MLEIKFQTELKLSRIKRCGGPAEITTAAGALLEGIHVIDKRRSGTFVEAIEQVETLGDDVQSHAFADSHPSGQAQIE